MSDSKPPPRRGKSETERQAQRVVDSLIDAMGAESFPASDPPTWGTVFSRLEQASRNAEKS
jgi:hypothetical protein